jgi:endonuclease III
VIAERGFQILKQEVDKAPLAVLAELPFIGRITAAHLAKNLGYPVAKNDRHLSRLASVLGFVEAQHLCESISALSGDSISIVDTVLWRFCAAGFSKKEVSGVASDLDASVMTAAHQ